MGLLTDAHQTKWEPAQNAVPGHHVKRSIRLFSNCQICTSFMYAKNNGHLMSLTNHISRGRHGYFSLLTTKINLSCYSEFPFDSTATLKINSLMTIYYFRLLWVTAGNYLTILISWRSQTGRNSSRKLVIKFVVQYYELDCQLEKHSCLVNINRATAHGPPPKCFQGRVD